MTKVLFTSESVTEGPPDKLADQASAPLLDALLTADRHVKVAVETSTTRGLVHVAGEATQTPTEITHGPTTYSPQSMDDDVERIMKYGTELHTLADDVSTRIEVFPDFPVPGIAFQNLCPVFADQSLLNRIAVAVADHFRDRFDAVLAIEARGFILGTAVAQLTGSRLVLARKSGKLPGPVNAANYALEYGEARLEVQHRAFDCGHRTLIVDDVLATGGTVCAAAELVGRGGGEVAGCAFVVAIGALPGLSRLGPLDVFKLITA